MVNHPNRSKRAQMRGQSVSCVDGRAMRHDPQPDDPYLQTDIGICDECDGAGCSKCETCDASGFFAVNVEAFELTGKVLCQDCTEEAFGDDDK